MDLPKFNKYNEMNLKIGYVGLTHLGINYAIASAIKGFDVVCYDENISLVKDLTDKKIPFFEKKYKKIFD